MSLKFKSLKFGIDLIEAVLSELSLLEKFDKLKCLSQKHIINEALRRYETLWLPLVKNYTAIIAAPIDIYWVWHVHMLSPITYQLDVNQQIGKTIDHTFLSEAQYSKAILDIKNIWCEIYPDESFDLIDRNDQRYFVSNFSYDIETAAIRQASFFYQVSLPHYRNKEFLEKCLVRYQMFLALKNQYPDQCIAPCYDIDIIWHAHQLHPSVYAKDTQRILGYILPHDDFVNDRSPDSTLAKTDIVTRNLWLTTFHEPFSNSGSMYRGDSSAGRMDEVERSYLYAMRPKVIELTMSFSSDVVRRFKYVLRVYLMAHNAKDKCVFSYDYDIKKGSRKYESFQFSTHDDIGFRVKLFRKIGLCTTKLGFSVQLATYQDFDFFNQSTLGTKYPYKIEILLNKKVFDTIVIGFTPKTISIDESFYGSINVGEFLLVSVKMNDPILWGQTMPSTSDCSTIDGIMASHTIQSSSGKHVFDINIIHSLKLNQSIVQVYSHDKALSIAHLIGKEQIPFVEQVEFSSKCPTLNSKESQRAMLIKDNYGDWMIIVGNWHMTKSDSGFFEMELFCLRDNSRCVHIEIDKLDDFYNIIDDLFVKISSGQIELRSCERLSELHNYTCLIFAISVLYILCKPRLLTDLEANANSEPFMNCNLTPDIKVTGKPLTRKNLSSADFNKFNTDNCVNAKLLKASGYDYDFYLPSNSFKKYCIDSGGCAGCVGLRYGMRTVVLETDHDVHGADDFVPEFSGDFISECDVDNDSEIWD